MRMLKPEEMCRVSIIGSKSVMKETIDTLYELKLLHIEDFYKDKPLAREFGLELGAPLKEAENIAATLVRVRSVQSHLPHSKMPLAGAAGELPEKNILTLEAEILALSDKLKSVDDLRNRVLASIKELEVFEELPLKLEYLSGYKSLSVFAGYLGPKSREGEILASVEKISPRSRVFFWRHEGKPVVLVFVENEKKDAVLKSLSQKGYSEINLSNLSALRGTAIDNLKMLISKVERLKKTREHVCKELSDISRRWLLALGRKEKELASSFERAQAPLRFAATKSTFIAEGWVPCSTYDAMLKRLGAAAKGKVYVEKYPDSRDAPVKLKHSKPVEPFEFFMNLYSLPRYTEIDPTFFMFLTFPLFFGMMLGDIGYGLITTALFMFLKRTFKDNSTRALLNVMIFASVSSIIFGFIFGEFFGEESIAGFELPRLLNRVEGISQMLLITAGMGIVQLNLGFLLGFVNKFKEHGFVHALLEKGSWFLVEAGVALIAADYLGYLSISPYAGWAVLALALLILLKGEGIKGIVELPSLLSNTLSYTRLMAVGLASVSLALVVNEFAREFFRMGGVYIFAAVMILLLGHGINLALGILGPFLQSLRLHYVEFFTKFFEGGGKRYQPFGK